MCFPCQTILSNVDKPQTLVRWNMDVFVYFSVIVCRNHEDALLQKKKTLLMEQAISSVAGITVCIKKYMHK